MEGIKEFFYVELEEHLNLFSMSSFNLSFPCFIHIPPSVNYCSPSQVYSKRDIVDALVQEGFSKDVAQV